MSAPASNTATLDARLVIAWMEQRMRLRVRCIGASCEWLVVFSSSCLVIVPHPNPVIFRQILLEGHCGPEGPVCCWPARVLGGCGHWHCAGEEGRRQHLREADRTGWSCCAGRQAAGVCGLAFGLQESEAGVGIITSSCWLNRLETCCGLWTACRQPGSATSSSQASSSGRRARAFSYSSSSCSSLGDMLPPKLAVACRPSLKCNRLTCGCAQDGGACGGEKRAAGGLAH